MLLVKVRGGGGGGYVSFKGAYASRLNHMLFEMQVNVLIVLRLPRTIVYTSLNHWIEPVSYINYR